MSEIFQMSDSTNGPARRSFRWQILPAAYLFTLGLVMVGSDVYCIVMAVYLNTTQGWIVVQPTPSFMNRVAFTFKNVSGWIVLLLLGSYAFYCSWLWMRSRWWVAFLVTLACLLAMACVGDVPRENGALVFCPLMNLVMACCLPR